MLLSFFFGDFWVLFLAMHVPRLGSSHGSRIDCLQRFASQIIIIIIKRLVLLIDFLNQRSLEAWRIASFQIATSELLACSLRSIFSLASRFSVRILPLMNTCCKSTIWNSWRYLGPPGIIILYIQLMTTNPCKLLLPLTFIMLPAGLLLTRALLLLIRCNIFRNPYRSIKRTHNHFLLFKLTNSFICIFLQLYILIFKIYFVFSRMQRIIRNETSVTLFIFLFFTLILLVFDIALFKKVMSTHESELVLLSYFGHDMVCMVRF